MLHTTIRHRNCTLLNTCMKNSCGSVWRVWRGELRNTMKVGRAMNKKMTSDPQS